MKTGGKKKLKEKIPDSFNIEDFSFICELGKGYFGTVLLVRLEKINKLFALKMLKKSEIMRKK